MSGEVNLTKNAKNFKENVKMWHDKRILKQEFNVGDKVLFYKSCFRFYQGKLLSKWEGPYLIEDVTALVQARLSILKAPNHML